MPVLLTSIARSTLLWKKYTNPFVLSGNGAIPHHPEIRIVLGQRLENPATATGVSGHDGHFPSPVDGLEDVVTPPIILVNQEVENVTKRDDGIETVPHRRIVPVNRESPHVEGALPTDLHGQELILERVDGRDFRTTELASRGGKVPVDPLRGDGQVSYHPPDPEDVHHGLLRFHHHRLNDFDLDHHALLGLRCQLILAWLSEPKSIMLLGSVALSASSRAVEE